MKKFLSVLAILGSLLITKQAEAAMKLVIPANDTFIVAIQKGGATPHRIVLDKKMGYIAVIADKDFYFQIGARSASEDAEQNTGFKVPANTVMFFRREIPSGDTISFRSADATDIDFYGYGTVTGR